MILQKLQMNMPDVEDLSFLQNENFYYDIFKIIFKCENFFDKKTKKKYLKAHSGEKIQTLLDFFGDNILGMKIEDIKGKEILEGNINHIKNFLELILALTNIDVDKNEDNLNYQINNDEKLSNSDGELEINKTKSDKKKVNSSNDEN